MDNFIQIHHLSSENKTLCSNWKYTNVHHSHTRQLLHPHQGSDPYKAHQRHPTHTSNLPQGLKLYTPCRS